MDGTDAIRNACGLLAQAREVLGMAGAEMVGRNPEMDTELRALSERLSELECDLCKCGFRMMKGVQ